MLIESPLPDTPVSELGTAYTDTANLPPKTEQKANIATYLALLFTLHHGRRDLMPLVWAWSQAIHTKFEDDFEPGGNMLELTGTAKWMGDMCSIAMDIIIDHRINTEVNPSNEFHKHETDCIVAAEWIQKMADYARDNHTKWSREEDGDPLDFLYAGVGAPPEAVAVMGFCVTRVSATTNIAALCQRSQQETDRSEANKLLGMAAQIIINNFGLEFVDYAAKVIMAYDMLEDDESMESVWSTMQQALFPHTYIEVSAPTPFTCAVKRRDYRWRNGRVDNALAVQRDRSFMTKLPLALTQLGRSLQGDQWSAARMALEWAKQQASEREDQFRPITFMRADAYAAFRQGGQTMNVYELEAEGLPSWHSDFSDAPMEIRKMADRRLWGELGDPLTFGVLADPNDVDRMNALRNMYGPVAVEWKPDVLDCATITINDSQGAPYAVPLNSLMRQKAMMLFLLADEGLKTGKCTPQNPGFLPSAVQGFFGYSVPWVNFIELQFHDSMAWADVAKVYIPNGLPIPD